MDEAVSSWLTRLALSQGTGTTRVMKHLRIPTTGDVDALVTGNRLNFIRRICGLSDNDFMVHDRIMTNLASVGDLGERLLLFGRGRSAAAYFCYECIRNMRTPYFPIHWRFAAWQWCPVHERLMDTACPKCDTTPRPLKSALSSRAARMGFVALNRCRNCGIRLDIEPQKAVRAKRLNDFSPEHQRKLFNGRALLSALYHGWFYTRKDPTKTLTIALRELASSNDFLTSTPKNKLTSEKGKKRSPVPTTAQGTSPPSDTPLSRLPSEQWGTPDDKGPNCREDQSENDIHVETNREGRMSNVRRQLGADKEQAATNAMLGSASYLQINDELLAKIIQEMEISIIAFRSGWLRLASWNDSWPRALFLIELQSALVAIFGDNQELIRLWLRSPNKSFQNRAPLELLVDPAESPALLEYLMAHRHQT